ncbi:stage ii sporulation protein e (spoiie) [Lucifera butyrica]|uniref:Stage ii sporulation protein e (Spoiie) n=1 Tax=Lucifera butyrica TaxID=1351585 RepID=A0A498RG20_9FIRM|nr:protein phosphatase 2C domain-containing protein [Lucifera butyrica]VBB09022.1 stage ii sporulation protein e (spoiie) [Lucifera butyrica]
MAGNLFSGQYMLAAVLLLCLAGLLLYRHSRGRAQAGSLEVEVGEGEAIGDREIQEDAGNTAKTAWGTLAVLADGMGRGQAGRTAALSAVRTFINLFSDHDVTGNLYYFFNQALNRSNREVLARLQGARGRTAVAAVLISKGYLHYASVGDIKIAVCRNHELIPLNEGHTTKTVAVKGFSQGILNRQEALAISQMDHATNYIGRDGFKNGEIGAVPVKLKPDDVILLMTAGIYKCLSWLELESVLTQPFSCRDLAGQIIGKFNGKPVTDKENASLFVLRYHGV